jgi:transcriptional regulator with XRE-family HTH domain
MKNINITLENKFKKHVGSMIKTHRVNAKLTQSQLASKLGITYQQLQNYESGRRNISIVRFITIVEFFKVSALNFLPLIENERTGLSTLQDMQKQILNSITKCLEITGDMLKHNGE